MTPCSVIRISLICETNEQWIYTSVYAVRKEYTETNLWGRVQAKGICALPTFETSYTNKWSVFVRPGEIPKSGQDGCWREKWFDVHVEDSQYMVYFLVAFTMN